MEILPAHRATGVRDTIRQAGAQLRFLQSYNPDLNPMEMAFAKFRPI